MNFSASEAQIEVNHRGKIQFWKTRDEQKVMVLGAYLLPPEEPFGQDRF